MALLNGAFSVVYLFLCHIWCFCAINNYRSFCAIVSSFLCHTHTCLIVPYNITNILFKMSLI